MGKAFPVEMYIKSCVIAPPVFAQGKLSRIGQQLSGRTEHPRVHVELEVCMDKIEKQKDLVAFSHFDNLANDFLEGAAIDRHGLARPENGGWVPDNARCFARLEARDEAVRQDGWTAAIAKDGANAVGAQYRPFNKRCISFQE